jgi:hypothetical protein
MACTNKQNPTCPNCNKSGLAILPVRYAVVPTDVPGTLPGGLGDRVADVRLAHNKYVLRTMRQGFLYLFHEKHPRGSHIKWEVYSVSAAGTLWKQFSATAVESIIDEPACSRKGHNLPASIITIPEPEKCGKVWLAFSEHVWSKETLNMYQRDAVIRERRMQAFSPANWVKSESYLHGMRATKANVDTVLEYQNSTSGVRLAGSGMASISQPDGGYNAGILRKQSTRHPVCLRRDQSQGLVDLMNEVGERPQKKTHPPLIMALWDATGIAQELNGFRNDAVGWIKQYGIERELELTAMHALDGVKKILEARAAQLSRQTSDFDTFKWNAELSARTLQKYDQKHPTDVIGRARQADLCRRWEKDSANKTPSKVAGRREHGINLNEADWLQYMARIDQEAQKWAVPTQGGVKSAAQFREERSALMERSALADAWPKYQKHIDLPALDKFRRNYREFLLAAAVLTDGRTDDNIAWIESSNLLDALTEFHYENLEDGVAFEDAVGEIIFGIGSSPRGAAKISVWVREARAVESNLLWRAIAVNQKDGIAELNAFLAAAVSKSDTAFTEIALQSALDSTKHLAKIGDLAKKSLSLHNTLRKDGITRISTGGVEKIFMTVGDRFIQPFLKKGTDLLSEKFIQSLILVRAGGDYAKVMAMMVAEAKFASSGRVEILGTLSLGHVIATKTANQTLTSLRATWAALVENADMPKQAREPLKAGAFNEAKELRFAMAATLLQGIFALKLAADAERDPKNHHLQAELLAARISFGAGVIDLGATAVKGLRSDAALSFQALKVSGGVLSAGAAWIAVEQDLASMDRHERAGQYGIAVLYMFKSGFNFFGGACSILASLSYAKPALQALVTKFPNTTMGRVGNLLPRAASAMVNRLFVQRAILMACGLGASLAVLTIQFLIWKFSDDELQIWCQRCAFGRDRHRREKHVEAQLQSLEAALKEVA